MQSTIKSPKRKGRKPVAAKKVKKSKRDGRKKRFSFKKWLFKWLFIAGIWGFVASAMILAYFAYDLPSVDKLYEEYRTPNIKILDKNGVTIDNIGDLYGEYVPYKKFPKHLVNAVVSTEDRRFFKHFGIDPIGIFRAAFSNYRAGHVVQGGSTITQQLAKVVFLNHERKMKRKIQEVLLALYLEHNFSKQEILTMYLNRIYFGSGNYGVSAAAQSYFGKKVQDINLFEAATLAGMIKAPSKYSPANNFELSQERADQVLKIMVDNDVINTDDIISGGTNQNFVVHRHNIKSKYPYFVDWVKEQLPDYIGSEHGEFVVKTTIDPDLQMAAENALSSNLLAFGKDKKMSEGAIVVLSPDGKVLAMVGGKDYGSSQFNRAVQAYRQPGSAFKLFVYLAAMEKGFTPDDTMLDSKFSIKGWSPKNWDNKYVGEVSLRYALANSINTVAVKLARDVGIGNVISTAAKLGISSDMNRNLSSALGTSEVNLLELTGAYAHLANNGNALWIYGIQQIKDSKGELLYKRKPSGVQRVISEKARENVNDMLIDVVAYGTGKNARLPIQAAGKTGTSQDSRDAWFIGYTENLVAGVWVGNDNNSPMNKVGGGSVPAIIWHDFMAKATEGQIPSITTFEQPFVQPPGQPEPTQSPKKSEEKSGVWDSIVDTFGGE